MCVHELEKDLVFGYGWVGSEKMGRGGLIKTGPTGTNVNDIAVALIG